MRCSLCDAECLHRRHGFCGVRWCRAHHLTLEKRVAMRWITPHYRPLLAVRNLTAQQAVLSAIGNHDVMTKTFPRRAIYRYGLDNPYMTEDARAVMVNRAIRDGGTNFMRRTAKAKELVSAD